MRRIVLLVLSSVWLAAPAVHAQLIDEFNPPRANCCLPATANTLAASARSLADQLQDWNQLGRYHADDQALRKLPPDPARVVFMGDSITDGWRLAEFFPTRPYVNRGIGGQTTPQMLVRMYPDVIDLKPAAMVVLAGTNDIAHNTGPETAEMIEENLMAMTELAQQHGIKVILCSITPISDYPALNAPPPQPGRGPGMVRRKQTEARPPADILKLNAWLKEYAAQSGATYVDYFGALVDEKGWLKEGISADGLHPNAEGYKLMAPLVEAAIRKVVP